MDNNTNIILAAPQEYIESASSTGFRVAHMIYRIGRGYHLFRAQSSVIAKNGLMVLDTGGYSGGGPSAILINEILNECERLRFSGIVLDTGNVSSRPLMQLTSVLAARAQALGLTVFIPEVLGNASDKTVVLISTALSGGTLSGHISDAIALHGSGRVALEIERVRMDFTLPAISGSGTELSNEELQALIEQHHPQSFLSKDLCANYFNYRDKKGFHFVLYDNGTSIRRKLFVASKLGVNNAFLFYPHVSDLLDNLLT